MIQRIVAAGMLMSVVACGGPAAEAGPFPKARAPEELIVAPPAPQKSESGALFWGTVKELKGTIVVLALRDGKTLDVDVADAQKRGFSVVPSVGVNLVVNGMMADGVLKARIANRAKGPGSWGPDVPQ